MTHATLSLTLLAQGRAEEALAEAMREPEEAFRLWALAIIHHALGHAAESDAALRELIEKYAETSPIRSPRCMRHAARWTRRSSGSERAYAQRDGGLSRGEDQPRTSAPSTAIRAGERS